MEVAESEAMSSIDDNGIGIGDIQSALHDGGGEEHIIVIVGKIEHHLLQLVTWHSAMSYSHTGIGDTTMNEGFQFGKLTDAWGHEEHLSSAAHLKPYGFGYHFRAEGIDLSLYGAAIGRRSLYDTQVPGSHQTELESARDRCGREGERIHIGLHLAKVFLCAHAKLLFLIDNQQTQVTEMHTLAYQLVCAYEDIHPASFQVGKYSLGIRGRTCTAEILHPDG